MKKTDSTKVYTFKGTNPRGRLIKGEISEKSIQIARTTLKKQGITVKNIRAKTTISLSSNTIKPIDITVFARQLATMMKSGVTIVDGFDIILTGITKQSMKLMVQDIKHKVQAGSSFANALRTHPKYFNELFCALVEAGENSGKLELMLDRIANYQEKSDLLQMKIKKAMKYPIAVLVISFIVTAVLLVKVIPQFSSLFESFGGELPAFTQMIVNLSEFTQDNWIFGLAAIVTTVYVCNQLFKNNVKAQHFLQRLTLKLPVFGDIIYKSIIARFTSTLATTFASGVPLIEALESAAKSAGNIVYYDAIMDLRSDVIEGQTLNFAMKNSHMFPVIAVQLTAIGEQTGALDGMLEKVANYYEAEVDNAVDGLTSMMEPLIMAILGVLVGGLVVAMYLPIFQMGSVI